MTTKSDLSHEGAQAPERVLGALREALLALARGAFGAKETPLAEDCAALGALLAALPAATTKSAKARQEELTHLISTLAEKPLCERPERLLRALALVESFLRRPAAATDAGGAPGPLLYDQSALYRSLQFLKGIGPKVADLFALRGIFTVHDLLLFLPRRYEDLRIVTSIRDLTPGTLGQGSGTIAAMTQQAWQGKRPFEVVVQDESGAVTLSWFHYGAQSVSKRFAVGDVVRFAGKVTLFRGRKQIVHPTLRAEAELSEASSQIPRHLPRSPGSDRQAPGTDHEPCRRRLRRAPARSAAAHATGRAAAPRPRQQRLGAAPAAGWRRSCDLQRGPNALPSALGLRRVFLYAIGLDTPAPRPGRAGGNGAQAPERPGYRLLQAVPLSPDRRPETRTFGNRGRPDQPTADEPPAARRRGLGQNHRRRPLGAAGGRERAASGVYGADRNPGRAAFPRHCPALRLGRGSRRPTD